MTRAVKGYDPFGNEVWRDTTAAEETNLVSLLAKAQTAIQTNIDALALPDPTSNNNTYLASPALVAGATAAQVQAYVRLMDAQIRALTNQNNGVVAQLRAATRQNTTIIRLLRATLDSTDGT